MSKRVYFTKQTAGSAGFFPLQIPKFLVSGNTPAYAELSHMSSDAKILYALFLDRLSTNDMSVAFLQENPHHNNKNAPVKLDGGYDEQGNAYIHYHIEEIQTQLSLPLDSVLNALYELETHSMVQIKEHKTDEPRRIYPLTIAPKLTPLAS